MTALRILLVDHDSPEARQTSALLAEAAPEFAIVVAMTAAEARRRLAEGCFDAVLADLPSRGRSSHDFGAALAALRRGGGSVPVIVLSANADETAAAVALREGADDYLVKGRVDGFQIKRAILNAVERQRARHPALIVEAAFESTDTGMMILDATRLVLRVNPAFTRLTGLSSEQVVGRPPDMLASGEADPNAGRRLWTRVDPVSGFEGEVWNLHGDAGGYRYPVWLRISVVREADGTLGGYVVVLNDISRRKEQEEALYRRATHDSLTGLPNRDLFERLLTAAVNRRRAAGQSCGVLFVDLDGFKEINDLRGHDEGDEVLKEAARRMRAAVRVSDEVARLAGDEFLILLDEVHGLVDAGLVAGKVVTALAAPYVVSGARVDGLSASVGVALCPADAASARGLVKAADAAMYRAKRMGKNRWSAVVPAGEASSRSG